jgi:hypothetical protein
MALAGIWQGFCASKQAQTRTADLQQVLSHFLVPHLQHTGTSLFFDGAYSISLSRASWGCSASPCTPHRVPIVSKLSDNPFQSLCKTRYPRSPMTRNETSLGSRLATWIPNQTPAAGDMERIQRRLGTRRWEWHN